MITREIMEAVSREYAREAVRIRREHEALALLEKEPSPPRVRSWAHLRRIPRSFPFNWVLHPGGALKRA